MSYSFMGQIHGFEGLVKNFKNLEKKISQLGYIPLDLQLFIQAGGYGVKLPKLNKGDQQTINLALQENNEIIQASLSMQTQIIA